MEITHKVMGILTFNFKNLIEFCMAGGKKGDGNGGWGWELIRAGLCYIYVWKRMGGVGYKTSTV